MAQVSERRSGLAWGLLGLTVVLLAGSAVIGLTGGRAAGRSWVSYRSASRSRWPER
jgi:hypothetical protein